MKRVAAIYVEFFANLTVIGAALALLLILCQVVSVSLATLGVLLIAFVLASVLRSRVRASQQRP